MTKFSELEKPTFSTGRPIDSRTFDSQTLRRLTSLNQSGWAQEIGWPSLAELLLSEALVYQTYEEPPDVNRPHTTGPLQDL